MKKRTRSKRSKPYYYDTPKTIESLNQYNKVIKIGFSKPIRDNFAHIKPNGRFGSNIDNCCSKGTCKHSIKRRNRE